MSGVRVFRIKEQRKEAEGCATTAFDGPLIASPGQFVMVWIPGKDEFPMSVSSSDEELKITYEVVGDGTRHLSSMQVGDKVGVRGPYGKGYRLVGEKALVVAGGTGMASLCPLVETARDAGMDIDVVIGARTASRLLLMDRCERAGATVHTVTDDGSAGRKGLATDMAKDIMEGSDFDQVYACGPEVMIITLAKLAKERSVGLQASLERYMKCGIGICDSCAIDGRHVCRDGPVFSGNELSGLTELGRTRLDETGSRTRIR